MPRVPIIRWVSTATSTNTLLTQMPDAVDAFVIAAREQTAGRGQRGNSWEAEPGKNLTFSMLLCPDRLPAAQQFVLSQIVALSIATEVQRWLGDTPKPVKIKWPNDIYYGDRKICGILIENVLSGAFLQSSIAGIGVNVNQTVFLSNAPNPVSMAQIAGREFPLEELLADVCGQICYRLDRYESAPNRRRAFEEIAIEYFSSMWRADGELHPFIDKRSGSPETFQGRICALAPMGHLTIVDDLGAPRTFAFKEVEFVL